jgi:hypothetical protein
VALCQPLTSQRLEKAAASCRTPKYKTVMRMKIDQVEVEDDYSVATLGT